MQYVYNDGEFYYFMDQETFEQIPLTLDQVEDAIRFMKEETMATVRFFKGKAFSVEAPNFVAARSHRHRAGLQGRHHQQHHQAGDAGDRLSDFCGRCSSTSATRSVWIPATAPTCPARKRLQSVRKAA